MIFRRLRRFSDFAGAGLGPFGVAAMGIAVGAASAPSQQPAGPGWDWRLTAVLLAPDLREVLFVHAGETRTVMEGEQVDGWTVTAIRRDQVTLARAGEQRTLSLEGFSPDERAAVVRALAAEKAQALNRQVINRKVSAALLLQQHQQQSAESALAAATKRMKQR